VKVSPVLVVEAPETGTDLNRRAQILKIMHSSQYPLRLKVLRSDIRQLSMAGT